MCRSTVNTSLGVKYKSPEGYHRHKCDDCNHVWEHKDSCAGSDKAHTCKCGSTQRWKYRGDESPLNHQKE